MRRSELQRRKTQRETLAKIKASVEEALAELAEMAGDRELTQGELEEKAALEVRLARIVSSISEAGG